MTTRKTHPDDSITRSVSLTLRSAALNRRQEEKRTFHLHLLPLPQTTYTFSEFLCTCFPFYLAYSSARFPSAFIASMTSLETHSCVLEACPPCPPCLLITVCCRRPDRATSNVCINSCEPGSRTFFWVKATVVCREAIDSILPPAHMTSNRP